MEKAGNRIREVRLQRGIGLNELARRCMVSGAYLCDLEHGNRNGSRIVLDRIASELGVSADELTRDERRAV
jgi:transcriptional regulator with XRE-family HTH domain